MSDVENVQAIYEVVESSEREWPDDVPEDPDGTLGEPA